MRIFTIVFALVIASASSTAVLAESSKHEMTQAQLQAEAKITEIKAREIALSKVPKGSIKSIGLEKEGALLIWSVDIATSGTKDITEVQVDAKTGAVVAVEIESQQDEKKEKDGHGKEAPPKVSH